MRHRIDLFLFVIFWWKLVIIILRLPLVNLIDAVHLHNYVIRYSEIGVVSVPDGGPAAEDQAVANWKYILVQAPVVVAFAHFYVG